VREQLIQNSVKLGEVQSIPFLNSSDSIPFVSRYLYRVEKNHFIASYLVVTHSLNFASSIGWALLHNTLYSINYFLAEILLAFLGWIRPCMCKIWKNQSHNNIQDQVRLFFI